MTFYNNIIYTDFIIIILLKYYMYIHVLKNCIYLGIRYA